MTQKTARPPPLLRVGEGRCGGVRRDDAGGRKGVELWGRKNRKGKTRRWDSVMERKGGKRWKVEKNCIRKVEGKEKEEGRLKGRVKIRTIKGRRKGTARKVEVEKGYKGDGRVLSQLLNFRGNLFLGIVWFVGLVELW